MSYNKANWAWAFDKAGKEISLEIAIWHFIILREKACSKERGFSNCYKCDHYIEAENSFPSQEFFVCDNPNHPLNSMTKDELEAMEVFEEL